MADTISFARLLRRTVVQMIYKAKASHIGGCMSAADILSVLYNGVMNIDSKHPTDPNRDRLLYSKGHAAAALYATLALKDFFPREWLENYNQNNQHLGGHVSAHQVPGVDFSAGSLGHGLPVGLGMALSLKKQKSSAHVFAILSDGEMDEGTTWECALIAAHNKLDNVTLIVDYNKIQSFGTVAEVLALDPLADKWRAFNWHVIEIDGHDHEELKNALSHREAGKPVCIIANTIKGKGVSFMENKLEFHYRQPKDDEFEIAMKELADA